MLKKLLKNQHLFIEKNLIHNEWISAINGGTLPVTNPFDQSLIGNIPLCGEEETLQGIESAENAQLAWKSLTSLDRADYLHSWANLIEENITDLCTIMTVEHGKPLFESKAELLFGISLIRWFADQSRRTYGDIVPANKPHHRILVMKQPVGVVGIISAWNFPVATFLRKAAPALAAGCTVVGKPAELTPFTVLALLYLAKEAQFPPGILNVITGKATEIGKILTSHPLIRAFSFTGSTAVGKILQKQCADTVKKVSLELGGNAPLIVFEDADLNLAIKATLINKFRNMGQACVCANRIYIHENVYDEFLAGFTKGVKALKLGNGLDENINQGPLISQSAINKVQRLIQDAVSKGAKIVSGGKVSSLGGTFFEPTIVVNVHKDMDIHKEEIFGPVAAIYKFSSEKQVLEDANNTSLGLAAYAFTNNLQRMFRVAEGFEAGIVSINEGIATTEVAPFGGYKESGNGREGGKEGLEEFLETKYVCIGI